MQALRRFARVDADRMIGAEQVVGQQQPVEDRQQPVVGGDLLVHNAASHQRVDPLGGTALERVASAIDIQLPRDPFFGVIAF